MPCLIAILALAFPRIIIILMVVFSDYLGRAYPNIIWPLLGFLFMPMTTLAYAFGINSGGGITGWYLALVILAVLLDLGLVGGGGRGLAKRRKKRT